MCHCVAHKACVRMAVQHPERYDAAVVMDGEVVCKTCAGRQGDTPPPHGKLASPIPTFQTAIIRSARTGGTTNPDLTAFLAQRQDVSAADGGQIPVHPLGAAPNQHVPSSGEGPLHRVDGGMYGHQTAAPEVVIVEEDGEEGTQVYGHPTGIHSVVGTANVGDATPADPQTAALIAAVAALTEGQQRQQRMMEQQQEVLLGLTRELHGGGRAGGNRALLEAPTAPAVHDPRLNPYSAAQGAWRQVTAGGAGAYEGSAGIGGAGGGGIRSTPTYAVPHGMGVAGQVVGTYLSTATSQEHLQMWKTIRLQENILVKQNGDHITGKTPCMTKGRAGAKLGGADEHLLRQVLDCVLAMGDAGSTQSDTLGMLVAAVHSDGETEDLLGGDQSRRREQGLMRIAAERERVPLELSKWVHADWKNWCYSQKVIARQLLSLGEQAASLGYSYERWCAVEALIEEVDNMVRAGLASVGGNVEQAWLPARNALLLSRSTIPFLRDEYKAPAQNTAPLMQLGLYGPGATVDSDGRITVTASLGSGLSATPSGAPAPPKKFHGKCTLCHGTGHSHVAHLGMPGGAAYAADPVYKCDLCAQTGHNELACKSATKARLDHFRDRCEKAYATANAKHDEWGPDYDPRWP
jgi:hypothetical protein